MACLGWGAVDVLFELGQGYRPGSVTNVLLPGGTFDGLDVVAVLFGATLAGAVSLAVSRSAS